MIFMTHCNKESIWIEMARTCLEVDSDGINFEHADFVLD